VKARALVLVAALAAALGGSSSDAAPGIIVEDWSQDAAGATGVPTGWSVYATVGGRPRYDFAIVLDEGRKALHMASRDDHSTIAKTVRVDLRTTPILEWSWKVVSLPAGADIRRRERSDVTGHLFVIWPRMPSLLRSRLIGYIWDGLLPVGSIETSRKSRLVTFLVAHSGTTDLGCWVVERRNVYEDYRRVYGEDPDPTGAIALSIDTNDTHSTAAAFIGQIAFLPASGSER